MAQPIAITFGLIADASYLCRSSARPQGFFHPFVCYSCVYVAEEDAAALFGKRQNPFFLRIRQDDRVVYRRTVVLKNAKITPLASKQTDTSSLLLGLEDANDPISSLFSAEHGGAVVDVITNIESCVVPLSVIDVACSSTSLDFDSHWVRMCIMKALKNHVVLPSSTATTLRVRVSPSLDPIELSVCVRNASMHSACPLPPIGLVSSTTAVRFWNDELANLTRLSNDNAVVRDSVLNLLSGQSSAKGLCVVECDDASETLPAVLAAIFASNFAFRLVRSSEIYATPESEALKLDLLSSLSLFNSEVLIFTDLHFLFPRVIAEKTSQSIRDAFVLHCRQHSLPTIALVPSRMHLHESIFPVTVNWINTNPDVSLPAVSEAEISIDHARSLYAATFTAQLHTILGLEHIVQEIGRSMFEVPRGSRGGIRGILLYGPPGTGKTSVARFLRSCEPALSFFWLNVTDVIRGIVGEAEQAIRDVFARAKKCARSVIFIDELQALFGRKSAHRSQSALAQLLTDIDNMSSTTVIIGATNRPDLLDPSLLRAGRLEWHVLVGLPSQAVRESILRTQPELASVDDFVVVRAASLTAGFSGADIVNLAKQAAIFSRGLGKPTVDGEDMSSALLGARASVSPWTVDVLQRWGEN